MENKETIIQKPDWLPFEEEVNIDKEEKSIKPPIDEPLDIIIKNDEPNNEPKGDISDSDKLTKQLEILNKQYKDTKDWGNNQRASYVLAKKRTEELVQKMFDDGTLFQEDLDRIKGIFDHSFATEDLKDIEAKDNPYKSVISNLTNTLEEYKKWNTDKDADLKFQSFFKHLDLVTPKKLKDIQEYLLTEEPKEALKYILDHGDKYYNKFYKQAIEKGDAFSYIEELTNKNEKLEKKIKELTEELDQTEGRVYSKSIKSRGAIDSNSRKPFESRWGESGNFFDN